MTENALPWKEKSMNVGFVVLQMLAEPPVLLRITYRDHRFKLSDVVAPLPFSHSYSLPFVRSL